MSYPTQNTVSNALPGTGVFGFGQVQVFGVSGTFVVPPGVNNVRVRLWGAGGGGASGGGGGFAMRTIYNLAGLGVTSVAVTVPQPALAPGGTASFGTFVSATGGQNSGTPRPGGVGVGGDINTSGGGALASNSGGGGVGSLWGNGGTGGLNGTATSGASGGGSNSGGAGSGLTGSGGYSPGSNLANTMPTGGAFWSIDFIGTGGGGADTQAGVNGGGSGSGVSGGGVAGSFPGGGAGGAQRGGAGLVVVEY